MRSPAEILAASKTIAIVGASRREGRPSRNVMRYLLDAGYDVVPVNPECDEVLGVPAVASLAEIDRPIDVVDVFRRSEHAAGVAREAVETGAAALWLQLGIVSADARAIAEKAGLDYVENECTAIVHRRSVA